MLHTEHLKLSRSNRLCTVVGEEDTRRQEVFVLKSGKRLEAVCRNSELLV